jgi:phosphatidate cytidylyltransferase
MLRQRVLSAILLLPPVLVVTYLGGVWFLGTVALAALISGYEFVRMSRHAGHALSLPLVLGLIGVLLLAVGGPPTAVDLTRLGLVAALVLGFAWQVFLPEDRRSLTDWGLTLAGGLYLGVLPGYLIALRDLPGGFGWAMWVLLGTWANDTGAYFVGKNLGRHKFSPRLSPHKTWEGSIGGWLSCLAVSLTLGSVLQTPLWQAALLGAALGPFATLGDLSVSFLKRQISVKDTGNLIPGHGGMLDRLDSLLFSAVTVYYWAVWRT